jgi:predicted  nucleic acid-binding Zn-ribbon protein
VSQSYHLFRLQEIDLTWEKVRRRLLQLQQISGQDNKVQDAQKKAKATEADLHHWHGTQKDAELETRSLDGRIRETEQRLMSGQVRNPKELESLQASVEALKRQKQHVETQAVEALLQVEDLTARLAEEQATLADLQAAWQEQNQAVADEILQRKKEFVYLKKLREQTAEAIPAPLLTRYEDLRKRKAGSAVAKLAGDLCTACNINVPTGIASSVRNNYELVFCPGCGRILHG